MAFDFPNTPTTDQLFEPATGPTYKWAGYGWRVVDSGRHVPPVVYDAASDAIFAAFTTPPTTARKGLIDAAVVALKAAGVWTKLDVLHVDAAADSQAALINWKAPGTFNGTLINAPTFTADRGFTGASSKRIETGFNPATAPSPNYVQNSACIFGWSLTDQLVNGPLVSNFGGSSSVYPRYSNGNSYGRVNNAAAQVAVASANAIGLISVSRSGATATEMFKNGISIGTNATTSNAVVSEVMYCMQYSTTDFFTGQIAVDGIAQHLNSTQQLALYNAIRTYLTGVGVP